ncbi:hypothetical protein E2C01_001791 [Portunus trituberculatus]|uniref:Uncharacterized protein n=1 Tax=Portunus trituberculatus TaxID=210409 RepID=A0A5B7CJ45_PORTR|nr:hypothetical protein [Portunus trituberculatus]
MTTNIMILSVIHHHYHHHHHHRQTQLARLLYHLAASQHTVYFKYKTHNTSTHGGRGTGRLTVRVGLQVYVVSLWYFESVTVKWAVCGGGVGASGRNSEGGGRGQGEVFVFSMASIEIGDRKENTRRKQSFKDFSYTAVSSPTTVT